jgi:hypothetical protein
LKPSPAVAWCSIDDTLRGEAGNDETLVFSRLAAEACLEKRGTDAPSLVLTIAAEKHGHL